MDAETSTPGLPLATTPRSTRGAALRAGREVLSAAGIESAEAEAEWLLAGILGVGRSALHLDDRLTARAAEGYRRALSRRARREPLQRILGWEEFDGLRCRLTDSVLVPRPETEVLVEWSCGLLPRPRPGRDFVAIDVGTGSGCIACALGRRRQDVNAIALDIAFGAARVAKVNAAALGAARVRVVTGDLLAAVRPGVADLIVSNPPYLPTPILASLTPEVRDHEPRLALDGGPDGLDVIRRLVREARRALAPEGTLALETAGGGQSKAVADLLNDAGFRQILVHNDMAGVERFVAGTCAPR